MARPSSPAQQSSQSIKQQREARRQEKIAKLKKQQARERRNRILGIAIGAVAAVAVLATVITVVVTSGDRVRYENLSLDERNAISIDGVQDIPDLPNNHIDTMAEEYPDQTVDYEAEYGTTPPAGGNHLGMWLNCGEYSQPVPNENAVHSLEHGAVWVTYDPSLDEETLQQLRDALPDTYVVLSPYEDLPAPIVLSAWGEQLQIDDPSDERLQQFINKFWISPLVPEPGASCAGALQAEGYVD